MTDAELQALDRQLAANEGRKNYLYDDATGKRITQGSTVIGHPTWGIGFNCDAVPFTDAAIAAQFEDVRTAVVNQVFNTLPWTQRLPVGPLRAVIDIAYNAGVEGLLGFHKMLAAAEHGDYTTAAKEVINSGLAPARAQRLAALMRS
jgi:lysozyme